MLHEYHAFQFGTGGDHETTPASCGFEETNSSNTVLLRSDIGSGLVSFCSYKTKQVLSYKSGMKKRKNKSKVSLS